LAGWKALGKYRGKAAKVKARGGWRPLRRRVFWRREEAMTRTRFASLAAICLLSALLLAGEPPRSESKQAQQVRQAELDFAATARAKDFEKFMTFWDDDIHFFKDGKMSTGREAQRQNWQFLKNPNLTITWSPEVVEASGGLGYTTGPFEIRVKQPDGAEKVQRGRYVTIWRRKADGSWKAALDIGSMEPPPADQK
jgi:ketosteroid isomerase-like protein